MSCAWLLLQLKAAQLLILDPVNNPNSYAKKSHRFSEEVVNSTTNKKAIPSLKLTFSNLKMDVVGILHFPIGDFGLFSGAMFVSLGFPRKLVDGW